MGTRPRSSPVAGLVTSRISLALEATQSPATKLGIGLAFCRIDDATFVLPIFTPFPDRSQGDVSSIQYSLHTSRADTKRSFESESYEGAGRMNRTRVQSCLGRKDG